MKMMMKTKLSRKALTQLLGAALAVSGAAWAPAPAQVPLVGSEYVVTDQQDLQQVVAPVALYPDALLAQTLVASTYPQDVMAAAQWLSAGGSPSAADLQSWDLNVQGWMHC